MPALLPALAVFPLARALFLPLDLRDALYQTHGPVVVVHVHVPGHGNLVPLERGLELGRHFRVKGRVQHLRPDTPKALCRGFRQVAAVTRGVEYPAPQTRQAGQHIEHHQALDLIRHVAQFKSQHAGKAHVLPPLGYPQGSQVALACEVFPGVGIELRRNASKQGQHFRLAPVAGLGFLKIIRQFRPGVRPFKTQNRSFRPLRTLQQRRRDIRPGTVPGDDKQFFVRVFPVKGDDVLAPGGFRLRAPRLALRQADTAVQPVLQGVVERNLDKAIGLVALAHFLTQQIEGVGVPVMRGHDHHLTAPHEQGQRRLHHFVQAVVEGRLVQDDHALAATQRTWPGRQGHDLIAGSKDDAVRQNIVGRAVRFGILEQAFLHLARRRRKRLCPHGRRVDELPRHIQRIAQIQGIHAPGGARRCRYQHGRGRNGPGQADAPAFLDDRHRLAHDDGNRPLLVGKQHVRQLTTPQLFRHGLPGSFPVAFPFFDGHGRFRHLSPQGYGS